MDKSTDVSLGACSPSGGDAGGVTFFTHSSIALELILTVVLSSFNMSTDVTTSPFGVSRLLFNTQCRKWECNTRL